MLCECIIFSLNNRLKSNRKTPLINFEKLQRKANSFPDQISGKKPEREDKKALWKNSFEGKIQNLRQVQRHRVLQRKDKKLMSQEA